MNFHQDINRYLIIDSASVRDSLVRLNNIAIDAVLFLVNEKGVLMGSLTDGDIRRGIINGLKLEDKLVRFANTDAKYFIRDAIDFELMRSWRSKNYKVVPVLDQEDRIVDVVNFRLQKSKLQIDAVIMAGGKGTRLRPLTIHTPKPLLKVGAKPIIEYNIDRLKLFGIRNITISIKYLGQQLIDYIGNGVEKNLNIKYVEEESPLGTIGAVRLIEDFHNDYILVMNSDLLTNINYEDLFKSLIDKDGDMIVATTPYEVKIPYGVIETLDDRIVALKEKPTFTYYSNAGIYIFKKEYLAMIPKETFFNAPDLMKALYDSGKKVVHYPILGYWLDIGKPEDYHKAQKDIQHLKF